MAFSNTFKSAFHPTSYPLLLIRAHLARNLNICPPAPWMLRLRSHEKNYSGISSLSQPVNGFTGAIGNTPLIRLKSLSEESGCEILGKSEFQNPGGSVKDRAALWIIQDAEEKGLLKPGGTVVEGTAGNTGIGLAHICRSRGYRCVIFMPNSQSIDKVHLLRMLGAEVFSVPVVPYDDPQNYNHQAARYAESRDNAVWTNQFDNTANREAHLKTTAPEIWSQTQSIGGIDAFVCATGTGGTLAGVSRYLKSVSDGQVKCFLADPPGSVLYDYVRSKGVTMNRLGSTSITEGIGQGRLTANLRSEIHLIDDAVHISDQETIAMVYRLLDQEGIYLGASSSLNVAAALQVAKRLGPSKTIVTILCDSAHKYQNRLFSRSWLESKGLFDSLPVELKRYVSLD
ncbi:hypothetical protein O181_030479 [Austropuccinia psidii MF-1]|uniref:Cysteine synthase 1 n=1 Tax=Austropuccinia psidii MF-1 TaxID=1389203 RepID=A0A9Q3H5L5_9BASI|nr:hypothetical protein [Austropuccinia psidii MF-1]